MGDKGRKEGMGLLVNWVIDRALVKVIMKFIANLQL